MGKETRMCYQMTIVGVVILIISITFIDGIARHVATGLGAGIWYTSAVMLYSLFSDHGESIAGKIVGIASMFLSIICYGFLLGKMM